MKEMWFNLYLNVGKRIMLEELIALGPEVHARVENSGSEGLYVEVMRFGADNEPKRLCFRKFLYSEEEPTPQTIADLINNGRQHEPIYHSLPTWRE